MFFSDCIYRKVVYFLRTPLIARSGNFTAGYSWNFLIFLSLSRYKLDKSSGFEEGFIISIVKGSNWRKSEIISSLVSLGQKSSFCRKNLKYFLFFAFRCAILTRNTNPSSYTSMDKQLLNCSLFWKKFKFLFVSIRRELLRA